MSLIKLKTKEEIKDFFKILAEESVKEAKKEVFSDDPMAPRLSRLEDEAKKAYDINEEEAPSISISRSAPEEDVSVDVELDDSIEPEEDSMSTSLESLPADIEDVSLDSVEKEINVLRGGRSLKDYEVSQGLKKYFDLLDQAERKALYAFLTALASVMTGKSSGEDAVDPSDPPYNVAMTTGLEDEIESEDISGEEALEDEIALDAIADAEEDENKDDEEVVPIRVGSVAESASILNLRNKVQELLKRS